MKKVRFYLGSTLFVLGLILPVFIPVILALDLSSATKVALSAFFSFGLPELLMLAAVPIMGREGFDWIKNKTYRLFRKYTTPHKVSRTRYRTGLFLFVIALLQGLIVPYFIDLIPFYADHLIAYNVALGMLLVLSLILLGDDFWDKIRALFCYNAKAVFPSDL
ncbi:MAG: hypothetical protein Q8K75_05830 [Chlamydiales bacterium]|nr:hypothetical protein [Chlamydiales bacterium]